MEAVFVPAGALHVTRRNSGSIFWLIHRCFSPHLRSSVYAAYPYSGRIRFIVTSLGGQFPSQATQGRAMTFLGLGASAWALLLVSVGLGALIEGTFLLRVRRQRSESARGVKQ